MSPACHPHVTEVDCTLSNHSGGFATIDPRHADDTPQSSAYGSNSPQATDKDKPHHQDNWTRMSNTTHATTPPQTSATASPTETPPAPPSQTPQHHTETQPRPNRRPLHPKHPMSPACHRGGLHFEQSLGGFCDHRPLHGHATLALPTKHSGGFATIDPRHADDTPQRSAYGSNSPQATNKDKPHHHDKHTKTSRTRPTQPPKEHAALALPSNHAGGFATIDPSTGTRRWPFRPSTRGVLQP